MRLRRGEPLYEAPAVGEPMGLRRCVYFTYNRDIGKKREGQRGGMGGRKVLARARKWKLETGKMEEEREKGNAENL